MSLPAKMTEGEIMGELYGDAPIIEGTTAGEEPQPEPQPEQSDEFEKRPYKPATVYKKLQSLVERYEKYTPTEIERAAVTSILSTTFDGDEGKVQKLYDFLFAAPGMNATPKPHEVVALKQWLKIKKSHLTDDFYSDDAHSIEEARMIVAIP
jgi:hypothetical protein